KKRQRKQDAESDGGGKVPPRPPVASGKHRRRSESRQQHRVREGLEFEENRDDDRAEQKPPAPSRLDSSNDHVQRREEHRERRAPRIELQHFHRRREEIG